MGLNTAFVQRPSEAWPRSAGWLVPGAERSTDGANCTWLEYLIVRRIRRDYGILEQPWASNRGVRLDAMTKRAGLSVPKDATGQGWYWCGIEVGTVWLDCGSQVPADYPATNAWLPHVVASPRPGSAILYGANGVAHHIGVVTRLATGMPGRPTDRDLLTGEGNRGFAGSASNDGVAVDEGPLLRLDVLGFVRPRPVPNWSLVDYAPAWFLVEHFAALPAEWRDAARAKIDAALTAA